MSRKYDLEKILGEIKRRKISVSQYAKENGLSYHNLSSAIYYAKSHQQIDTESLCITSILMIQAKVKATILAFYLAITPISYISYVVSF